jgi:peptidoglycan/xylan/chitin deacetylase (PgdA/CDA1 family)
MADSAGKADARPYRHPVFLRLTLGLHATALALAAVAPQRWAWAASALLLNHSVITAAAVMPRSRLLGPNLAYLPSPEAEVALTFDDGPDPYVTPGVMDILERHHAKATFFCIGNRIERFPEVASAIVERGHAIGNHSHNHPNTFAFYGPRALAREVIRAQEAIWTATSRRATLFRAPVGIRGPFLEQCLAREGLNLVSWSRRGLDTVSRSAAAVASRLTRGLEHGEILLMHDGASARDSAGRPVVLEALARVLDVLAARGLRVRPLPEFPPDRPPRIRERMMP